MELGGPVEEEAVLRDVEDGVVEDRQRGRRLLDSAQPLHAQQRQPRVDTQRLEHRVHQRSLVLAVAEAAAEDRLHRVGLERVDPELQAHVAGARHHELVDGADARRLVALRDALDRFLGGLTDLVGDPELILDQAPVEAAHVFPGAVGGDVHVGQHLAGSRHGGLGHQPRHFARDPALPGAAVLQLALGMDETGQRRGAGVEGAARRSEQHVVADAARLGGLQIGEVAEVVGEEVGPRVVGAGDQLDDVARLELWEGDHPGAHVVVEAVPGLGEVALALRLALQHAAVPLVDAGALDLHHLPIGRILHALHAGGVYPARAERPQDELMGARGEAVGEHLGDGKVREHFHVVMRDRRQLRQRLRVVEVGFGILLLGADRADQLAQRGVLRAQAERAGEGGQGAGVVLGAQPMPAELLVRLGIVGRQGESARVSLVGLLRLAVLAQQLGGAQARIEIGGLERERLAEQLQGAVQLAAIEAERNQVAARLAVIEAERQRAAQLFLCFFAAAEAPQCAGGCAVRARQAGMLPGRLDPKQRSPRREAHRVQRAGLGEHRIDQRGSRGACLLRQLQGGPAFAAIEAIAGQRIEQRGIVGMGRKRGLDGRAALVRIAVLQPRQPQRRFRLGGRHLDDALHRAQRHPLALVLGAAPLQHHREILLGARVLRISGSRSPQLVEGRERLSRCPLARSAFEHDRSERLGRRIRRPSRLRQRGERRVLAVGDPQAEPQPPGAVRDLQQEEIVARLERAFESLLIEARRVQRGALVHQLAVQPHAHGAAGAEMKDGRLRLGRGEDAGGVHGHIGARIDGSREIDEPVRRVAGGNRPPAYLVLLARVDGLRVEAFLFRRVLGEQAGAPLVGKGADDAPGADWCHRVVESDRLGDLALGEGEVGPHLDGERTHVRSCLGRAGGLLQGRHQGRQVAFLIAALIEPEEVCDRLRRLQLAYHPGLQGERGLVQRGRSGKSKCGEQQKTVHAIGLPRDG